MSPESLLRLDQPAHYQIVIQGKLPENWDDFFGEMTPTTSTDDEGFSITTLTGEVVDQSSLHGILRHIRDLGLPLLQIKLLSESTPTQGKRNMSRTQSFSSIFHLALKGIALAMSIAAIVTGILKTASTDTLVTLLSVGLAALAFSNISGD